MDDLYEFDITCNNNIIKQYKILYEAVVIRCIRDAVDTKRGAEFIFNGWADTPDCKEVCSYAGLSYEPVYNFFKKCKESEEYRIKMRRVAMIKSTRKSKKE